MTVASWIAAAVVVAGASPATAQSRPDDTAPPADSGTGAPQPAPWEPDPGLVDYVSVSAKVTEPVMRTPGSVAVVTAEQIARGGYRSVAEAVADVPGVFVSYDLDNYNVAVRGLYGGARAGSRYLKVMIDGRTVTFVHSGVHYLGPEFIPISAVERIEVMRGPVSSLYGAGALVGAINIVTRRPAYEGSTTSAASISLRGGALGVDAVGAEGVQTVVGRRTFVLLAAGIGRDDRSGLSVPVDSPRYGDFMVADGIPEISNGDLARPAALLGRLEHVVAGGRLTAMGLGQFHDAVAEFHDLTILSHGTRVSVYNAGGTAAFERSFASGVGLLATAGYWRGGPRGADGFDLGDTATFTLERRFGYRTSEGSLELRYDWRGGWLLAGVDGQYDREQMQHYSELDKDDGQSTPRTDPGERTLANAAGYAQALIPVGTRLRLATGLRWDQHNIYGGALSGRAAAVLSPHPQLAVKLLGGRSYKAPSPEQLFGVQMDDLDVDGDEGISPQFLNGAELVVSAFPAAWLSAEIAGYYQRYSDALAYVRVGDALAPVAFDAESWGTEASLRAHAQRGSVLLDAAATASYQRIHTAEEFVDGVFTKAIPDNEGTPIWLASARGGLRFDRPGLAVHARYRHAASRTPSQSNLLLDGTTNLARPSYRLAPYDLVDVSLSREPFALGGNATLRLQLTVHNLLDARYADIGFNGVDVPGLGRTIWLHARADL